MKYSLFSKLSILAFFIIACAHKTPGENENNNSVKGAALTPAVVEDTFETGKVITQVICKTDAFKSYALYIPAKENNEVLPVIYFFDPHADGALPLNKYKALADAYHFILIGSNNSKNGNDWPTTENIWQAIFADTKNRLKIDTNRIYTCGFSGGAKVAGYIALNHQQVKGIIANGAGLPDGTPAGNFHFSFTAVAGQGDMNMTDLVAINNSLDKTQTRHSIIFFDGKHEWAPVGTMNIAFAGLQLDAMRGKLIAKDDAFINSYTTERKKAISDFSNAGNFIKAVQQCKLSVSMLDGLTNNVNGFKEKEASIERNPVYLLQCKSQQNIFATEQKMKEGYMQQFQQRDINYWSKTISGLQAKANATTAEGAMYQRLLAYLSLAFYSISNQLITANQDEQARYFVELYKMADATNSEAWYFSAILNARSKNAKATEDDLLKAVANGFTDKDRMIQQPEFQGLSAKINFSQIESEMNKLK